MAHYLRAFPADDRAHLLMAQLAMDRPDAQPQLALDQLGRIRPGTPKEAAVVRFSVGKAHYQQKRYDLAETCWKEALELDPTVPEAGWAFIDLLDFEAEPRKPTGWACGSSRSSRIPATGSDCCLRCPGSTSTGSPRIGGAGLRAGLAAASCVPSPGTGRGFGPGAQQPVRRGDRGAPRRLGASSRFGRGLGCLAHRAG